MNNNTGHIISNENDVPSVTFIKWPLDMDDDEFRAGYPFTEVPFEKVNEQEKLYVVSSTSNNDTSQSVNPQNNDFNKTTAEDNESSCFLFGRQAELIKSDVKASRIHDDNNDYSVSANQKQDNEEHERKQYDQHSILQTDNVNDKQTNQAYTAK